MPPASDEPVDDDLGSTTPYVPAESASVDSEATSSDESSSEAGDLGATFIPPIDDALAATGDWAGALADDVEPGHTIKAPQLETDKLRENVNQMVALKRRDVSQQTDAGETSSAAGNADADYHIGELLGEGGMGAVYAARQQSMDRPVAIKVLKSQLAASEGTQEAFVSEAVITGRLDHPNIVPIYDVGKQPNDALFYAMKQVEGVEWKERFATNTVSENLDTLLRVADAIAFAHARGIIHRDLKPANIMLGPFGEVLVMDWGLAMPTEDHPSRETFPDARAGGTPHYMAPEMANGTERVDRRSDVYLLGAILFEIVTGKPPHALDLPKRNRRERVLAVLDAVANNVIAPTDESGELLDIARKTIATEPGNRYQSVPEFQTALREYLSHEESIELSARAYERLAAGRQSGEYTEFSRARFGFETALEEWPENERAAEGLLETRFDYAKTAFDRGDLDLALSLIDESDAKQKQLGASIRRAIGDRDARQQQIRRLRRISLAASLVVAIVSIVAAVWINSERSKALTAQQEAVAAQQEEAAQREVAQSNEKEAQEQRQVAESERTKAESERVKATAAEADALREADNARESLKIAERNAYYSDMLLLRQSWNEANIGQFHQLLDLYRDRDDLRNFEWAYWDRQLRGELLTIYLGPQRGSGSFSPDGTQLAAAGLRNAVCVWNAVSGQKMLSLEGHSDGIEDVTFSPDGTLLASASRDKTVKVWSLTTGKESLTLDGHTSAVRCVSFGPDGAMLASASDDRTVRVWDVATGQDTLTLDGHTNHVHDVSFSADGTLLASTGLDKTVKVWDLATGQATLTLAGHLYFVSGVSFSPDMTRVASAGGDHAVKVWDLATGEASLTIAEHANPVMDVSFSPDGTRLASASNDNTVKVWDTTTGREVLVRRGHKGSVNSVSFSPDGTQLATVSADRKLKVWDAVSSQDAVMRQVEIVTCVAFSKDGSRLASASWDGTAKVWDVASRQMTLALTGHENSVRSVEFSPDGTNLATASLDKTVKIWNSVTGKEIRTISGHTSAVRCVSFSPDGAMLASASDDRTVKVWDATTGKESLTLDGHTKAVNCVSFSPDGEKLASVSDDSTVRVWDTVSGRETLTLQGSKVGQCLSVSFSPDGTRLASAHHFGGIRVWDLSTGHEVTKIIGHADRILSVSFSPDGTRLASGSKDNTLKIWDAATGQETLTIREHEAGVQSVSFSPDGTQLVSGGSDKTVRLWDARPWTPELRVQSRARGYLAVHRQRAESLEDLQAYIGEDKTISEAVRQQCLDWAELFWKNRTKRKKR